MPVNSKDVKERELDARIAKIRQKNLDIIKRKMEIQKEKELFGWDVVPYLVTLRSKGLKGDAEKSGVSSSPQSSLKPLEHKVIPCRNKLPCRNKYVFYSVIYMYFKTPKMVV